MNKTDLSVIILTRNEKLHIKRCIESLINVADKIILVDSFSEDETLSIAKEFGDKITIYERKWKNYADQFQWAIDNADIDTKWVMRMDADEYFEQDLIKEIPLFLAEIGDSVNSIYVRRKYFYKNKWIKHGGVYPLHLLRIWRTGQGRVEQRWMDEHIVVDNPHSVSLKGHIVDDNLNDMNWWTLKHIKYADREVIDLLNVKYCFLPKDEQMKSSGGFQARLKRKVKENIYLKLPASLRSGIYFLYRIIIRLGFLDGAKGWDYHLMQGLWYRSYVDIRYKELDALIKDKTSNTQRLKELTKATGLNLNEELG